MYSFYREIIIGLRRLFGSLKTTQKGLSSPTKPNVFNDQKTHLIIFKGTRRQFEVRTER